MSIFTKKSIAELQLEAEKGTLRRSLGRLNLTALGVGSIIGREFTKVIGRWRKPMQTKEQPANKRPRVRFFTRAVAATFPLREQISVQRLSRPSARVEIR